MLDCFNKAYQALIQFFRNIRASRKARWILNISLGIIFAAYLVYLVHREFDSINGISIQVNLSSLFCSLAIFGVNTLLLIWAWHLIVSRFVRIPLLDNAEVYASSQLVKALPTPVWFITGRILRYSGLGLDQAKVVQTIGIEILLQIVTGLAIISILQSGVWLIGLLPLILVTVYPTLAFLEIKAFTWKRLKLEFTVILICMINIVIWLLGGYFFKLLLLGVNASFEASFATLLRIWISASMVAFIGIFLLGGIGILREFTLTFTLGAMGMKPLEILIVATSSRLMVLLGNIFYSLLIIGTIRIIRKLQNISPKGTA